MTPADIVSDQLVERLGADAPGNHEPAEHPDPAGVGMLAAGPTTADRGTGGSDEPQPTATSPADPAAPPQARARRMMRQYELVERVALYNPHTDEALLNRAYVYSMRKHGDQVRASGDPYFSHPLEVAAILTGMRLDDATIATALLHDVIEDTDATRAEIDSLFGAEIGKLVDGLTKIGRLRFVSQEDKQGENLRKLLLAVADDVRVLLVKLADRLHNMRTLQWVPPHKRARIAQETMDVYAPLAARMGIQWMREELEHLAFTVLYPDDAEMIERRLSERRGAMGTLLTDIENEIRKRLEENDIDATVTSREKRAYSIYLKMQRKLVNFESLSDIYGFRVMVGDVLDCYRALGVVHTLFQCVPERFKDYISIPKQNDYRSLHTTIVGPQNQRVELQIRTRAMHRVAEYGIAAHVLHKDGAARSRNELIADSTAYAWLRTTVEQLSDEKDSSDFLHDTKLELFQDRVFCFTPRGQVIALPPGATPIDFAYQVHTQIGNTCTGCRVNGHMKPLVTPLKNGDEVEILCEEGATPPATWRSLAVTGKARAAIRKANREADRRKFISLGHELIGNEAARRGVSEPLNLGNAAKQMSFETIDTLVHAVGKLERPAGAVLSALGYGAPEEAAANRPDPVADPGRLGVPIRGLRSDLPVHFSSQYPAIPGDGIVGVLDPGKGVTILPVHASEAIGAYAQDPTRWLDVSWDVPSNENAVFPVGIHLLASNTKGALADIARVISEAGSNIDELTMISKHDNFREMQITLEVADRDHLSAILERLATLEAVSEAERAHM